MTQTCRRGKLYTSSTTTCPIEYCKLRELGKAQPKSKNALSPDFVQKYKMPYLFKSDKPTTKSGPNRNGLGQVPI